MQNSVNVKSLQEGDWIALTPKIAGFLDAYIDIPARVVGIFPDHMDIAVIPYDKGKSPENAPYRIRQLCTTGMAQLSVHKYDTPAFLEELEKGYKEALA